MSLGDALVLLGITVALLLYELERWWADRRDLKSALNVLSALRGDALVPYGDRHFDSYDAAAAHDRAQKDYDSVMVKSISDRVLGQVWQVPIEPLVTLIGHPGVGSGRIGSDTVRAEVMALRQINVYNQVVGQQTDFNALHLADIKDPSLPKRRIAIADGAFRVSEILHRDAIGTAEWWRDLKTELDKNVSDLEAQTRQPWCVRLYAHGQLTLAFAFFLAALGGVAYVGYDKADAASPRAPSPPRATTP